MADDRSALEKIASWIPFPIPGVVKRSKEQRGRVEGTIPNPMEQAAGIVEPPKAEGKSTGENREQPRNKFYK